MYAVVDQGHQKASVLVMGRMVQAGTGLGTHDPVEVDGDHRSHVGHEDHRVVRTEDSHQSHDPAEDH